MKATLKDAAPRHVGHVDVNISKNGNTLEIGAVGVEPPPIVLEYYGGKLTLRVFDADGKPTVVQEISTKMTTIVAKPAVDLAAPVIAQPALHVATAEPTSDFDEAAFDAA